MEKEEKKREEEKEEDEINIGTCNMVNVHAQM